VVWGEVNGIAVCNPLSEEQYEALEDGEKEKYGKCELDYCQYTKVCPYIKNKCDVLMEKAEAYPNCDTCIDRHKCPMCFGDCESCKNREKCPDCTAICLLCTLKGTCKKK
jgi:hypothetical protein